jgi:hypothetical protein
MAGLLQGRRIQGALCPKRHQGLRSATATTFAGVLAAVLLAAVSSPAALAVSGKAPGWVVTANHYPTNLSPGDRGTISVGVFNVGAGRTTGPITVTDKLPPGLTATRAGMFEQGQNEPEVVEEFWDCTGNGPGVAPRIVGATTITCTNDTTSLESLEAGGGAPNQGGEVPEPELGIAVAVAPSATEQVDANSVTIAGGGASTSASASDPITIGSTSAGFGIAGWDGWFSNADGTIDTQAGSHPYEATFSLVANTLFDKTRFPEFRVAGGELREVLVDLPPGFVGNPNAVPQCTRQQLNSTSCPNASQVGVLTSELATVADFRERVFNMVPPPGVAAEFAVTTSGIRTFFDASVRSGSDYGITTRVPNVPQRQVSASVLTLWGNPGDTSHDPWRNGEAGGCSKEEIEINNGNLCGSLGAGPRETKPFLTLPTACAGPQMFRVRANTWQHPDVFADKTFTVHDANGDPTGFTGCEFLGFAPALTAAPDTARSDTPTGLTVEVKPPTGGLEDQEGLSTSDIKNTVVTLPPGLVINPGQAAGLQACQPGQDGLTTPQEQAEGKENNGPPSCPNASKVGTVTAKTPLLEGAPEKELQGNVYVMQSNPPHLKLMAAFSADGVNIKLVLNVELDERTGQITTRVANVPEFPVNEFKLSFSGGAQAALDTPTQCGTYNTTSDFTPWSSPFIADFSPSSAFSLSEGPGGGSCPSSPLPFSPTLTAGSTTDQAGAFTNFSLLLQRGDGQERIEKLQFKEPAGLAGLISSVPLCDEANANAGTCPEASHIGHAVVASGPGPYPLVLPQPGAPELPIYLTGPYKGAPFGLSIVTPVIAGPFNLGTVITRASIAVDPTTAQITITTDPLPQIVEGVPTDLRSINSIIDRPNFLFNPTNCTPAQFTGTAWGTPPPGAGGPSATAPLSSHFGVGSCRELAFHPKVAVTTAAKSSKANGASLFFKISYPKGALGKEAWFNEAKFDLPKQLPARLTTIQKACLAATFESNPAACPPASLIGHAIVHTQVLPVPLAGPVYFVSHGGAKFPDAVIVLQGDGVTVNLTGETFIDGKTGITSATFRNTPDVPFENIEVTVPAGPFSEFAANLPAKAKGSFCGQKLVMPTLFKAQNGLEIHQNTTVGVTGCAKKKALTRKQKLAAALKACRKKAKGKRAGCARAARKRYGAVKGAKKRSKKK